MKTIYPTHPMRDFNEWITAVHNYFRMTATEYVNNLHARKYTRFKIEGDGKGYYIVGDEKIPQKEFEERFPLPLFLNAKPGNPDGLRDYSNDLI
jgi:hypothetical protein